MTPDKSGVELVISADSPENAELVTVPLVQQGIDRMRAAADYVVVDTPATFSQTVLAALDASDAIVLVADPHVAGVRAAKNWLDILDKLSYPQERSMLILNRTSQGGLENDQVARHLGRKLDVIVPFTTVFDDSADRGRPLISLHPDNSAAKVMRDLATRLAVLAPVSR